MLGLYITWFNLEYKKKVNWGDNKGKREVVLLFQAVKTS